jgi:hypothetical protein
MNPRIVALEKVAGSSPVGHPKNCGIEHEARLFGWASFTAIRLPEGPHQAADGIAA